MSTPLSVAAKELEAVVDALSHMLESARTHRLQPQGLAQLNVALEHAVDISQTRIYHDAAGVLARLAAETHLTPETTDAALARINAILQATISAKPNLGPMNPGTLLDWYGAALGGIAQTFSKLAFIEYVRTKAGNFGAKQTADQAVVTLRGARNLLSWILDSPDENNLPVPDGAPSVHDEGVTRQFSDVSSKASDALEQRAIKAKALFEFLASWSAPELPEMTSSAVKACIISGHEPYVLGSIIRIVTSEERHALLELAAYRGTVYDNSKTADGGQGNRERIFANVYDAIFAHLAIQGEYGAKDYALYRGHRDSRWRLEASYYRAVQNRRATQDNLADVVSGFFGVHTAALDELSIGELDKRTAELQQKYSQVCLGGLTSLQQEAVIQHYLSGTKLLDFTTSIYVAAFFATSSFSRRSDVPQPEMGAIYRVAVRDIGELALAQVEAPELPERFARIHRQHGVFLRIRFRDTINEPGLWDRWVFRHTKAANPFQCSPKGISTESLLTEEICDK